MLYSQIIVTNGQQASTQTNPQNIYITTTMFATNDNRVLKTGATNVFQQQANSVTGAAPANREVILGY